MGALEEQLFRSGLPVEALMEKAALAVARRLLERERQRLERHGAVVLAGPGHNGGDGLVVARELHLAGIAVAIWSPYERHKPLTANHLAHAQWLGLPRLKAPPPPELPALWIDALFGIGQHRSPDPPIQALFCARQRHQPGGLVAVDVPTGLCADSGTCLGESAAVAQLTLCIGLLKQGLVQDGALRWVGEVERLDLGLPSGLLAALPDHQPLALRESDLAGAPWPTPERAAGKYGRGRLLVVAGSPRYRGAASLALAGASASGCGSLQAALPEELAANLWSSAPHVVVRRPLRAAPGGGLLLADLVAADFERMDAVVLGPGIGGPAALSDAGAGDALAWEMLQQFPGLLVLDADGLNRLASRGVPAVDWLRQRPGPTWLTPHRGEFARLFPALEPLPALDAARAAAEASQCCVLLKGAHSLIASPDGNCWQLLNTAPSAARAGLGDVLAGYAAGLGAQGLATGTGAGPDRLATAALAHACSAMQLARQGPGCASPGAVAAGLARIGAQELSG